MNVPDSLQHLHRLLALSLSEQHGFNGKDALNVATACIEALQRAHGGDRLGSRGVYIPVYNPAGNDHQRRKDKIREMMGPSPHSRTRARQVAVQLDCAEITVWRAVRKEQVA